MKNNQPKELPRWLVEDIYKASCCRNTPEEAQKEPCACVAGYLIEVIEEWGNGYSRCNICDGHGWKTNIPYKLHLETSFSSLFVKCEYCQGEGCTDENLLFNG